MKHLLIITALLLSINANTAYSQFTHEFGLGYNHYFSHLKVESKAFGATFRYGISWQLFERTYINTSFCTNMVYDYMTEVQESWFHSDHNRSLNIQIPVNIMIEAITDKFFVYTGPSLNLEMLQIQYSVLSSNPLAPEPTNEELQRGFGIGFQIGVSYMLTKKIGVFTEYKIGKRSNYGYSFTEIGIKYTFK